VLFAKVEKKLSCLANEVHGTRAVQKFVEEGVRRDRTGKILTALSDHVEPLSRSVTGSVEFVHRALLSCLGGQTETSLSF